MTAPKIPGVVAEIVAHQQNSAERAKSPAKPLVTLTTGGAPASAARQSRGIRGDSQRRDTLVYTIMTPDHPEVRAGKTVADDPMVQLIKRLVNAAAITSRHVEASPRVPPDTGAYNLVYGLRTRPTITLESVDRWMSVLGMNLHIAIEPAEPDKSWFSNLMELHAQIANFVESYRKDPTVELDIEALASLVEASQPDPNTMAFIGAE